MALQIKILLVQNGIKVHKTGTEVQFKHPGAPPLVYIAGSLRSTCPTRLPSPSYPATPALWLFLIDQTTHFCGTLVLTCLTRACSATDSSQCRSVQPTFCLSLGHRLPCCPRISRRSEGACSTASVGKVTCNYGELNI